MNLVQCTRVIKEDIDKHGDPYQVLEFRSPAIAIVELANGCQAQVRLKPEPVTVVAYQSRTNLNQKLGYNLEGYYDYLADTPLGEHAHGTILRVTHQPVAFSNGAKVVEFTQSRLLVPANTSDPDFNEKVALICRLKKLNPVQEVYQYKVQHSQQDVIVQLQEQFAVTQLPSPELIKDER